MYVIVEPCNSRVHFPAVVTRTGSETVFFVDKKTPQARCFEVSDSLKLVGRAFFFPRFLPFSLNNHPGIPCFHSIRAF